MTSNKKRFSLGWAIGISLGVAIGAGVVYAGSIGDTYTTGTVLDPTLMNNIKTAVGDNDTRITGVINNTQAGTLKTTVDGHTGSITTLTTTVNGYTADINNLKGNLANGGCRANDGTVDANAARVGPLCVDKFRARATVGSCAVDGTGAGCNSVVALSTGTGPATTSISWAQAVRACANAGKRLPTPGEWMMAYTVGTASEMTGLEWVDSVTSVVNTNGGTASATGSGTFTYPAAYPASTPQAVSVTVDPITIPSLTLTPSNIDPVQVGYMGPRSSTIQFFSNTGFTDNTLGFVYFRCVR